MSMTKIPLRCYATRLADGHWRAVCIDLQLILSGPSLAAVREAMQEQVHAVVHSARLHQVARRIPFGMLAAYGMASWRKFIGQVEDSLVFTEAVMIRTR